MRQVLDWSKSFLKHFEIMTRVPHGSGHEKAYSDMLAEFAKEHGYAYKQYDNANIIIYAPASAGYEDHPTVVLQGHMDMVWEKTPESPINFETDPLDIYVEDGQLKAHGTTLGADDGVAAAYMLSVLEDQTLPHPPLECIFTVDEEVGLTGAFALDPADISGRRLIGMDDGGAGRTCTVSSAGGIRFDAVYAVHRGSADLSGWKLTIGGLQGGHSGGCIHKEMGNSIGIAARIVRALSCRNVVWLESIDGGSKENAIPRDCTAVFATLLSEADVRTVVEDCAAKIRAELAFSDPDLTVVLEPVQVHDLMDDLQTKDIIEFLCVCPTGMRHQSVKIQGHTTASENLAVVTTTDREVKITVSIRSSFESYIDSMADELMMLAPRYHLKGTLADRYPAWAYEENSWMRQQYAALVKELLDADLKELAVHGGLECGIFKGKWPDMDIVTLGPTHAAVHTPQESLDLESFEKTYDLLKEFLRRL